MKIEQFGISKTKYAIDNAFDILNTMIETFGDGVQVWDLRKMPGLGKDVYDIVSVYKDVKEEAGDYSPKEIKEIVDMYGEKAIQLFWTNDDEDYYGIENVKALIECVHELLMLIIEKAKAGINIDDIDSLPEIKNIVKTVIASSPEAKKELYNLTASEIALLGSDLAMRVLLLVKH